MEGGGRGNAKLSRDPTDGFSGLQQHVQGRLRSYNFALQGQDEATVLARIGRDGRGAEMSLVRKTRKCHGMLLKKR